MVSNTAWFASCHVVTKGSGKRLADVLDGFKKRFGELIPGTLKLESGERLLARGGRASFGRSARAYRKILQDHERKVRLYKEDHDGRDPEWCPAGEKPTILVRFLHDRGFIQNQAETGFYGMFEPNECSDCTD